MKNTVKFVKSDKSKNYIVINNEFLKRDDLSWKAKGLIATISDLPESEPINLDDIMALATDGEASFRSGWEELIEAGYIKSQSSEKAEKALFN